MKVKHILALFFLGIFFQILGGFFKILHLQGAVELMIISMVLLPLSILLGIWKLFTTDKFKEFLNS